MYTMNNRSLKDLLYEQVSRVGKALASPKRLEILEMLAQGEKAVETVATDVAIDRLTGQDVAVLGVSLRHVAEEHLVELRLALQQMMADPKRLVQVGRKELLAQAKRGEVIVLDVRPAEEYDTAHLP